MSYIRQFSSSCRIAANLCTRKRILVYNANYYATKHMEEQDINKPIKYSATPASKWQAEFSRTGINTPRLWYEPYVILVSISVFLIYFCVLREENDMDIELEKSLYERIHGLEETQLYVLLEYNRKHGLETKEIMERLREIQESKNKI